MSSYAITHEYGRAFISCTLINTHTIIIHSIGYYGCSVSVLVEIITQQKQSDNSHIITQFGRTHPIHFIGK